MKSHYHKTILTFTFCLIIVATSFGQSKNKKDRQILKSKSTINIKFDTSKTTIISFNSKNSYPFDNSYKSALLRQDEINTIDSLFIACVSDYNKSLDRDQKGWSINLNKYIYRKQLIVATNKKGEKQVWLNCFCDIWNSDRWKTEIMFVEDGGSCYFKFKINLKTKKFYDLEINSLA